MLRIFFGDLANGRLQRLPFAGWYALLALLILLIGFGIGASIGVAERLVGGEVADAQATLMERFGIIGLLLIAVTAAVLLFAQLNIAAKRIRDMGLPGWWVLLGVMIAVALLGPLLGEHVAAAINLMLLLVLVVVPSDTFGRRAA